MPRFAVVALAITAVLLVAGFTLRQVRDPYGGSDAVTMWNLHSRVLHRDVAGWRTFLGEHGLEAAYHADYPLLLPCNVARLWTLAGDDRGPASPLVAAAFLLSVVLVLGGTVARLRDRATAVFVVLVLLGSAFFVKVAARQFADVPLACYLLAAVSTLVLHEREARQGLALPLLAGLFAGFAAWTKNEGLLFVVALGVVWGVRTLWGTPLVCRAGVAAKRTRHTRGVPQVMLAGLLPGLALAVWYKLAVAPPNDLVAGQSAGTLEKLLDVERYLLIGRSLVGESLALVELGGLALVVHLYCVGRARSADDRASRWMLTGLLGLMLAGYAAVYLTTPWDLRWHLGSSARRLLAQLWPVALLWYATLVRPLGFAATSSKPESAATHEIENATVHRAA